MTLKGGLLSRTKKGNLITAEGRMNGKRAGMTHVKLGPCVPARVPQMNPEYQDRQLSDLCHVVPPQSPAGLVMHPVGGHFHGYQTETLPQEVKV